MAKVRGKSDGISHLHSWCSFMHKIKGRRLHTPFAELEAKNSVWRPQLLIGKVGGQSSFRNQGKTKHTICLVGGCSS